MPKSGVGVKSNNSSAFPLEQHQKSYCENADFLSGRSCDLSTGLAAFSRDWGLSCFYLWDCGYFPINQPETQHSGL